MLRLHLLLLLLLLLRLLAKTVVAIHIAVITVIVVTSLCLLWRISEGVAKVLLQGTKSSGLRLVKPHLLLWLGLALGLICGLALLLLRVEPRRLLLLLLVAHALLLVRIIHCAVLQVSGLV